MKYILYLSANIKDNEALAMQALEVETYLEPLQILATFCEDVSWNQTVRQVNPQLSDAMALATETGATLCLVGLDNQHRPTLDYRVGRVHYISIGKPKVLFLEVMWARPDK